MFCLYSKFVKLFEQYIRSLQIQMFIRNLWGRSNAENADLNKYDKITFQINPNENIPQVSDDSKGAEIEEELTPSHPLYHKIFKEKQEPNNHKKYKVKPDDSLIGISLKLNISEKAIKSINDFSGDTIFPGMTINLPQSCDISILEEQQLKNPTNRPKISQLFQVSQDKKKTYKYDVYYCSSNSNIRGLLTINPNYIMFNPSIQDQENKKAVTTQKLLKYNAIIQMEDIKEVLTLDIPEMTQGNEQPKIGHIIQLLLYRVGNKKLQEKYKERLDQLKIDKKAIASVSFKVVAETENQIIEMKNQIKQKIGECLNKEQQISQQQKGKEKGLTNITHFDILYANIIMKKDSLKMKEQELTQKINQISIRMTSQSMIAHEVFVQIAVHFPLIYQLHNWSLLYSCLNHGTSFNTMMRNCKGQDPLLLVIKQYKGRIFGAFLIDQLQFGRSGRGQMFIWKYDDQSKKVSVYKWTTKNQFFVFIDSDGMGIGMGKRYGIYVNSFLQKGFSAATQTFGNTQPLSVNEEFMIDNIQIWGLESTY